MSVLTRHEVVHWFTTPEELRKVAYEMEELWNTCMSGQDKTVYTVFGKDTQMLVIVDQERIKSPDWREQHGSR